MSTSQQPTKPMSLLRQFAQPIPRDLGAEGTWTWEPTVPVDTMKLAEASPTTEYSTENGED